MLSDVFQGFLVGLVTSAPVGPIAILCIQRTVQKGHWHGFASGLGAASSDFIYALIAIFGLSFVTDFIDAHEFIIQLVGCIFVAAFGIHIFFQNPSKGLRKSSADKTSYWQEYVTAFLLTFSNPLMIFLFLGVFARFHFLSEATRPFDYIVGMLSVLAGALSWWLFLTSIASLFHGKFNIRGLWILNKITGSLIAILAVGGFILTIMGTSISTI